MGQPLRDFIQYVHHVTDIIESTGVKFAPSRPKAYEIGLNEINRKFGESRQALANAVPKEVPLPTGQTLHQALDAYRDSIDREYRDADGTISDNGKTKQI